MNSVTDSIFVEGPVETVYGYCWDAKLWPEITPHVKQVRILEEDNASQHMAMTVESDGRLFQTESKRRAIPLKLIEYEQLTPPPFLRAHSGEWRFHSEDSGTRIELTHRFLANHELARQVLGLNPVEDVDAYIAERLKRNGMLTLASVRQLVESQK